MDTFLKEYYEKNRCPAKHILHHTALADPNTERSVAIGVTPPLILPHLQQADAPALEPHMLVGRGVAGAAPPGPPSAVHSKRGERAAPTPVPSTPEPMDGVDRTSRGVRRERQSGPRASLVSLFEGVAPTPQKRPRRDAGPATPPTRPPDAAARTPPPEPHPAKNLQTKRSKNFDQQAGNKYSRGELGRTRTGSGAPGRSARLAGRP